MRRLLMEDRFREDLERLDNSVRIRILKAIDKICEKPELGKPLRNELAGHRGEHVGGWRVVYEYDEQTITLIRCRKREESY